MMSRAMDRVAAEHAGRYAPRELHQTVRSTSRASRGGHGSIEVSCTPREVTTVVDWGQKMNFSAPVTWQFDTQEPYSAVMRQDGKYANRMIVEAPRRMLEQLQETSVLVLHATSARGEPVTHVFRLQKGDSNNVLTWLGSRC